MRQSTLDDLVRGRVLMFSDGYRTKKAELGANGCPILRVSQIGQGRIEPEADLEFVREEFASNIGHKLSQPGDAILTTKGTVGRRARVTENDRQFVYSPQVCFFRIVDAKRLDPDYFYYWLASHSFRAQVDGVRAQTDMADYVSLRDLGTMKVDLPDPATQRQAGSSLRLLDDKIDVNRRIAETLERIARTLFKSWFVDFDPVRNASTVPKELRHLFPTELMPSVLGRIPAGWQVQPLGDLLSVIEAGSRPSGGVGKYSEGVPSIGAESIDGIGRFDFAKTKYVPEAFFENMNRGRVDQWDVLLYKDGGRPGEYEPHVAVVGESFPFDRMAINEHVLRLRSALVPHSYLYLLIDAPGTRDELRQRGTGVAIPGITATAVSHVPAVVPPRDVLAAFDRLVKPMLRLVLIGASESKTLAEVRDALLPKLISGEVQLGEGVETSADRLEPTATSP